MVLGLWLFLGLVAGDYLISASRFGFDFDGRYIPWGVGEPWNSEIQLYDESGAPFRDTLVVLRYRVYPFIGWEGRVDEQEDILVTDGKIRVREFGPTDIVFVIKNTNNAYEVALPAKNFRTTTAVIKKSRFPIYPKPKADISGIAMVQKGKKLILRDDYLEFYTTRSDTIKGNTLLEIWTDGSGKLEMKDPNGKVLGITSSLTSRGIDDVYDLDKLDITDSLFHPFQPMELVADLWSRVHLVKYAENPDAVIAFQYSADMRPSAPDSSVKWFSVKACVVRILPDRRSCDFTTCKCEGSLVAGAVDGRIVEPKSYSLYPDSIKYPRPRQ